MEDEIRMHHLYHPASVVLAASAAPQQATCQTRMRTQSQNSVQGPSTRSIRLTTFMLGVGCSSPVAGSNLQRQWAGGAARPHVLALADSAAAQPVHWHARRWRM